ncbi:hypothetical protein WJX73_005893 [Symbiochloris irregularis]|uniref:HhH-GPD domain-containing protein n=1 Tax=Symbiochloris irregularis TaxID=706552 RepID=A0AAW1P478_9CHLO
MRPPKRQRCTTSDASGRPAAALQTVSAYDLKVPSNFDIATAVCSYGFFMLEPNHWTPDSKTFARHLQLSHTAPPAAVSIQADPGKQGHLRLSFKPAVDEQDLQKAIRQVTRMLCLSEQDNQAVTAFQKMHPEAAACKAGRLFRSPTIWEDLVKSITLCNCGWTRTISMNAALCKQVGKGAFPSPLEIIAAGEAGLAACGVGYRAKTILKLAQQVEDGALQELETDADSMSNDDVMQHIKKLSGMGPFTATNVLACMGRYDVIPCDSETLRHLKATRGSSFTSKATLQQDAAKAYAKYHPYQFLAYWFELQQGYEALFGPFTELARESYGNFTSSSIRKGNPSTASS